MAFANSLSGLIAAAKALDVIGNNIANSQTVGFKSSIARFTSISAAGKSSSAADTGSSAGVSADNIFQQLTQGKFQISDKPLDMAISGLGFFRLFNPETGKTSYTRDGQFSLSFEGNNFPKLVSRTGLTVTGNLPDFGSDPAGIVSAIPAPVEITIDPYFPPSASSSVALSLNLDSRVAAPALPFDPTNPLTYNGSAAATVYDVVGEPHNLRMYFSKPGAASSWLVHSTLDYDAQAAPPFVPVPTGPVSLDFDTRGAMSSAMPISAQTYTLANGDVMTLDLEFTGSVQLGVSFGVNSLSQDGYAEGFIQDSNEFQVAADGLISARYSNGQRRNVAQLVLANFSNANALVNIGDGQWTTNDDPVRGTGTISLGFPKFATQKVSGFQVLSDSDEGMGSIQGHATEQSNIDLGTELVALIEQQRNYQASAQTFKILDQVLQNLANIRSP